VIPSLSQICKDANSIETDHLTDSFGRTLQARWEVEIEPPPGFSSCQAVVTWKREGRSSTVETRLYRHKPDVWDGSGLGATFRAPTTFLARALIAASEYAHKSLQEAWSEADKWEAA
jgi:hypothetical protein